jgi:glycosyltransferase involved in cell wall biosynthesis
VLDTDDWEQAWNPVAGYPSWQRLLFTWQEGWGLRHADAVTVASLRLKQLAAEVGIPHERIFYVPNGIRPAITPVLDRAASPADHIDRERKDNNIRARYNLGQHPVILLYTRFAEFQLSRLKEIISRLVVQVPRARWLVVGQGFAGEEETLADQLREMRLDEYAVFAGWVPTQEVPRYFAAADVAAFPFDDTPINQARCSVKLTDLLAAGLPVVTDAVGQNKSYIVDGETGILVPPGDTSAFAAALACLLSDEPLRRRLGAAAQRRMLQHFTWPDLVGPVEEAYRVKSPYPDRALSNKM